MITEADVRKVAKSELTRLRQEEYDVLKNALDGILQERMVEKVASDRGIDVQQLMEEEVGAKIAPVTDAEIDQFFTANQARIKQPKEQIVGSIQAKLTRDHQAERFGEYLAELRQTLGVKIALRPYRVEVSVDDDPMLGPKDAPVTIVEFSDFECGYCARASQTVHEIAEKYGAKVRVVFRDFPLEFHSSAKKAHEAAACANEQGKFWAYHDLLFGGQRDLSITALKGHATKLGLDQAKFDECLDGGRYVAEIEKDIAAGVELGVSGTPAFFVNGRMMSGAQPAEAFASLIDEELSLQGMN